MGRQVARPKKPSRDHVEDYKGLTPAQRARFERLAIGLAEKSINGAEDLDPLKQSIIAKNAMQDLTYIADLRLKAQQEEEGILRLRAFVRAASENAEAIQRLRAELTPDEFEKVCAILSGRGSQKPEG